MVRAVCFDNMAAPSASSASLSSTSSAPFNVDVLHHLPASLPDDERMQKEIDRLMDWLESKHPSLSFDERMQKAEEIFERQELARIRLSKERTDALMAFVPQSNAGASIGLLAATSFIHSFIHSFIYTRIHRWFACMDRSCSKCGITKLDLQFFGASA